MKVLIFSTKVFLQYFFFITFCQIYDKILYLLEAENHEKQTIASFEQDRNDFERLCSNHTTEQYENHVKKMKNSLSDMGELEKVKTRCKFDIKSSKRTEVNIETTVA